MALAGLECRGVVRHRQAEQDRIKVVVSHLDTPLADSELRSAKQRFWSWYRLNFPTEMMYPSDATVSRVSRELTKRMLCVPCPCGR